MLKKRAGSITAFLRCWKYYLVSLYIQWQWQFILSCWQVFSPFLSPGEGWLQMSALHFIDIILHDLLVLESPDSSCGTFAISIWLMSFQNFRARFPANTCLKRLNGDWLPDFAALFAAGLFLNARVAAPRCRTFFSPNFPIPHITWATCPLDN